MCLRLLDAAAARFGLGHDDEARALEQLTRRRAEGAVVVDDEHPPRHDQIVPSKAAIRSVASSTVQAALAW